LRGVRAEAEEISQNRTKNQQRDDICTAHFKDERCANRTTGARKTAVACLPPLAIS
jgi:hypothetical protein